MAVDKIDGVVATTGAAAGVGIAVYFNKILNVGIARAYHVGRIDGFTSSRPLNGSEEAINMALNKTKITPDSGYRAYDVLKSMKLGGKAKIVITAGFALVGILTALGLSSLIRKDR